MCVRLRAAMFSFPASDLIDPCRAAPPDLLVLQAQGMCRGLIECFLPLEYLPAPGGSANHKK